MVLRRRQPKRIEAKVSKGNQKRLFAIGCHAKDGQSVEGLFFPNKGVAKEFRNKMNKHYAETVVKKNKKKNKKKDKIEVYMGPGPYYITAGPDHHKAK